MKKVIALVLALALALTLTACGGTSGSSSTASKKDKYVIGISQPFMGHPVRKADQILIDEWAAKHTDVEITVTDGQLNAQKQIADLEDLMAKKVDLILVAAHQSATLVGVLRDVKSAGIPIIAFDRTLTDTSVELGQVVNDEYTGGKMGAELIIDAIGTTGDIAVLEGPAGGTSTISRGEGFMAGIKGTGIKVVANQTANFQRVQAVDVFENMLQANPTIKAVYCQNDEMALGVIQVLEAAGRTDIKVVGYDGQKDALEAIIAGKLYGTVRKNLEFPAALDMAYEYLTKGGVEKKDVFLDPIKLDSKNVKEYYKADAVF